MSSRDKGKGTRERARRRHDGGFTVIELSIVLVIIGLIASIAFVTFGRAIKTGREAGERMFLNSLKTAVEQFKQDNGFLPPLVNDNIDPIGEFRLGSPINQTTRQPMVRDAAFLRGDTNPAGARWSVFSLPYYLTGTLGSKEDGIDGPGYTRVQDDGTFSLKGRKVESLFDFGRDADRIRRHPNPLYADTEAVFVDRWGKVSSSNTWLPLNTIRYYRWEPKFYASGTPNAGKVQRYNVPPILALRASGLGGSVINEEMRTSGFAIFSKGPDGLADNADPTNVRNLDNLVEMGR